MPIKINVPIQPTTLAPVVPSGMLVVPIISIEELKITVEFRYYASESAHVSGGMPMKQLPEDLPKFIYHEMTRQQYASTPDIISIAHTKMRARLEEVSFIGAGNTQIVNFPEP